MLSPSHSRRTYKPATGGRIVIPLRDKVIALAIVAILVGGMTYTSILFAGRSVESTHLANARLILAELPADVVEANAVFRTRILSEFPVSTPEETLVGALSHRGFILDGWFSKRMTFRWLRGGGARLACDFTASVTWESDDQNRIHALDARLLTTPGCAGGVW
jgi:hypothetical protein